MNASKGGPMTSPRSRACEAVRALPALRPNHVLFAALSALLVAGSASAATEIKSDEDKVFYVVGTLMAPPQLKMLHLSEHELDLVMRGIRDTTMGNALPLDPKDFEPQLKQLSEERHKAALEIETKESGEYLVAQSKLEGAEATPTGLIFTEVEAGSGILPTAANTVRVKYTGRLRDGTVFDERTAEFPLSGVIPCWTEGVGRVKVGGKARLVCPSELAYGNNGMPPVIPPGAALTFDVELIEIIE
jgi:FKBP-type peptidyl-prolyl cis-trans isomerase FkpA